MSLEDVEPVPKARYSSIPNMTIFKLRGLASLFRFELPFSAGTCVVLGEFLALGSIPDLPEIVLGFLSIFFISATALILNDYFDIEIDKINAPHRPLPAGIVTKREVLVLSIVVAGLGFLASLFLSLQAFVVAVVVWFVGFLYNWRFKRSGLIGNLMVSFSVGMTFVFGGIVVGQTANINALWFGAIAMLLDLGEEIAADAMDADGDKIIGSRSLAILYGRERALRISAGIFGATILVSVTPFILGVIAPIYLVPIAIMDIVIVYSTVDCLIQHPRTHGHTFGRYISAVLSLSYYSSSFASYSDESWLINIHANSASTSTLQCYGSRYWLSLCCGRKRGWDQLMIAMPK